MLKGCVVWIVGDLSEDAYASHWWTEANISQLLKRLKIKSVKYLDKTVTHVVCSRSAYKNVASQVKSMLARARQGRKTNRTIKIVTFDWLEDSIDAGKPIPNTDKYDPGKPRGIDGMVAAWKETKFSSKTDICGSNKTARVKKVKKATTQAGDNTASDVEATSSYITSSAKNVIVAQKSDPSKREISIKPVTVVYKDKTDNFPYQIQLTQVRPDIYKHTYTLEVKMMTNCVPVRFQFEACRVDERGKTAHRELGSWVSNAKEALDQFTKYFRKKTGYAWEQRLLKVGSKGGNGGKCLYKAPARGEPTGAVPPMYTPGHPRCHRPTDLLPKAMQRPNGGANMSGPLSFEEIATANTTRATTKKNATSKPTGRDSTRRVYKKGCSTFEQAKKRKLEEDSSSEHQTKVRRTTKAEGKSSSVTTER